MPRLLIKNAKALVGAFAPGMQRVAGADMAQLPIIADGWMLVEEGRIAALGPMSDFPGIADWSNLTVIDACLLYTSPSPRD